MRPLPMDAPAQLRQRIMDPGADGGARSRTIAQGPLVLLVHALCAVARPDRQRCWIEAGQDVLSADDALALLRHWEAGVPIEDRV
ncbi:hypothetical protein [uncultured Sphingomonas sp.]|uniref:hypothetical protein n=1 Tax=uncultured Sphingomonas sp. TaxID=158754 RepID=UPI0025CCDE2A|nr:hypothetical protein [uncultured Sphingomonas sp.]